ncbi:hypothetical protein AA0120_g11636 [Alternaria tenuissima]|nr:hypothetical protein AA0120_g11636 [Alternaria tenuissima]
MIYHFRLVLLFAHLMVINAGPLNYDERQDDVKPHGLSTEALLTLVGVCVAVLGIALTLVSKWDSLKRICIRCCLVRSRSRRNAADPQIPLVNRAGHLPAPLPSVRYVNEDGIARPLRVQICPTEQQRLLLRTRTL